MSPLRRNRYWKAWKNAAPALMLLAFKRPKKPCRCWRRWLERLEATGLPTTTFGPRRAEAEQARWTRANHATALGRDRHSGPVQLRNVASLLGPLRAAERVGQRASPPCRGLRTPGLLMNLPGYSPDFNGDEAILREATCVASLPEAAVCGNVATTPSGPPVPWGDSIRT